MNSTDFIFDQVYKGALKVGASERAAKDNAQMAMDEYRKGKFKKAHELIKTRIAKAKKGVV